MIAFRRTIFCDTKRFRIPGGLDAFFQCPTTEELLELNKTIEELRKQGADVRAQELERLDKKIRSAMRRPAIRRHAQRLYRQHRPKADKPRDGMTRWLFQLPLSEINHPLTTKTVLSA